MANQVTIGEPVMVGGAREDQMVLPPLSVQLQQAQPMQVPGFNVAVGPQGAKATSQARLNADFQGKDKKKPKRYQRFLEELHKASVYGDVGNDLNPMVVRPSWLAAQEGVPFQGVDFMRLSPQSQALFLELQKAYGRNQSNPSQ